MASYVVVSIGCARGEKQSSQFNVAGFNQLNYNGVVNVKFAQTGLMIFDFEPKKVPHKELHIKIKVNFQIVTEYLFLGHLMNFHDGRVESYDIIFQKSAKELKTGILHQVHSSKVSKAIKEYLLLDKSGYLSTPKHVYDLESLEKWLSRQKNK